MGHTYCISGVEKHVYGKGLHELNKFPQFPTVGMLIDGPPTISSSSTAAEEGDRKSPKFNYEEKTKAHHELYNDPSGYFFFTHDGSK